MGEWVENIVIEPGLTGIVKDVRIGDLIEVKMLSARNRGDYAGYVSGIFLEQRDGGPRGRNFWIGLTSEHPARLIGSETRDESGGLISRDYDCWVDTGRVERYRKL